MNIQSNIENNTQNNIWSFFQNIYVISLQNNNEIRRNHIKTELSRFPNLNYTFFDAINPLENQSILYEYLNRGIIGVTCFTPGQLGLIASNRIIWEKHASDNKNNWILIIEDDIIFHPLFNENILSNYLKNVPEDATYLKFGFLAAGDYYNGTVKVNNYWKRLEKSYSTSCYAIKISLIQTLLNHCFIQPIDWVHLPNTYGMCSIDELDEIKNHKKKSKKLLLYKNFYKFYNEYINGYENFYGVISNKNFKSSTFGN